MYVFLFLIVCVVSLSHVVFSFSRWWRSQSYVFRLNRHMLMAGLFEFSPVLLGFRWFSVVIRRVSSVFVRISWIFVLFFWVCVENGKKREKSEKTKTKSCNFPWFLCGKILLSLFYIHMYWIRGGWLAGKQAGFFRFHHHANGVRSA